MKYLKRKKIKELTVDEIEYTEFALHVYYQVVNNKPTCKK